MSEHEIEQLVEYLRTSVSFPTHVGLAIDEVRPGSATFHLDVGDVHMNGAGAVHGGVHAALMDSAMAVALLSLGLKVATTQMNVHYVEPVTGGRIVCTAGVVHRARRSALAEARIQNEAGALLAIASASFRIFEPSTESRHASREAAPHSTKEYDDRT